MDKLNACSTNPTNKTSTRGAQIENCCYQLKMILFVRHLKITESYFVYNIYARIPLENNLSQSYQISSHNIKLYGIYHLYL